MNIARSSENRYDGQIRSGDVAVPFSGMLELLKVLEDLVGPPTVDDRHNTQNEEGR